MTKWQTGHVAPWWQQDYQELAYVHEPFNNARDLAQWRNLGFTQQRFTGELYDMRFREPEWIAPFRDQFPMQHFSWSVYRMRPGDVLPEHGDTYERFCKIHAVSDIQTIRRYIVFLEDWKRGHYFEIEGAPVVQWKAGTWVSWQGDTLHVAANIGSECRYTLQLTGLITQQPESR
jgi:hypothetical protein